MHVCMYVSCLCMYMCVCNYMYMYVCMYVYVHVWVYVGMYILYVYVYVCMHKCTLREEYSQTNVIFTVQITDSNFGCSF